jgi:hypothetical protein
VAIIPLPRAWSASPSGAVIIAAWPTLPEPIKRAMLAL